MINSVQEALAGELEMQGIYDVVGDKIREIFDTQGVAIATVDDDDRPRELPYLKPARGTAPAGADRRRTRLHASTFSRRGSRC